MFDGKVKDLITDLRGRVELHLKRKNLLSATLSLEDIETLENIIKRKALK